MTSQGNSVNTATVEVDGRGRVSLGKTARSGTYRATAHSDGTIVLEPVVTLTAIELAIMRNPKLAADLDAAFAGTMESVEFDWQNR